MLSKKIAYMLFGVIISLSLAFGFFVYSSYTKNQNSEEKINKIISQFEEKFKNDSIYLTNANKMLIDKISQHIIDSMSIVYEDKLENVILKANKYKQLLIANNINPEFSIPSHSKNTNSNSATSSSYSVTTYSKLKKKTEIKNTYSNQLNITTISKLKNNNLYPNVTTYSKINTPPININPKNKPYNITTYSKLKKTSSNNLISNNTKEKSKNTKVINTDKKLTTNNYLSHNNYTLDHAQNINNLDKMPVYKGCENLNTEDKRKNCFAISISQHIFKKFNSLNIQNSGLKKGLHKVRVLFIIDEHGKAKIGKLVGKWPHQIYKNVKFAVETIPPMKPGYSNNKAISVKYSLLIPFIID